MDAAKKSHPDGATDARACSLRRRPRRLPPALCPRSHPSVCPCPPHPPTPVASTQLRMRARRRHRPPPPCSGAPPQVMCLRPRPQLLRLRPTPPPLPGSGAPALRAALPAAPCLRRPAPVLCPCPPHPPAPGAATACLRCSDRARLPPTGHAYCRHRPAPARLRSWSPAPRTTSGRTTPPVVPNPAPAVLDSPASRALPCSWLRRTSRRIDGIPVPPPAHPRYCRSRSRGPCSTCGRGSCFRRARCLGSPRGRSSCSRRARGPRSPDGCGWCSQRTRGPCSPCGRRLRYRRVRGLGSPYDRSSYSGCARGPWSPDCRGWCSQRQYALCGPSPPSDISELGEDPSDDDVVDDLSHFEEMGLDVEETLDRWCEFDGFVTLYVVLCCNIACL
jgi:hypothetical protein